MAMVANPGLETLALLHALIEIGAPAYLIHARLPDATIQARVEHLGLPLVSPPGTQTRTDWHGDLPPVDDSRPLAIVETSGSTGEPKRVVLARRAFVAAARASEANLGWCRHDRWLLALPPAHIGGLSIVTRCLLARKAVVIGGGGSAGALISDVEQHQVTLLSLVPTQLRRLLTADWRCPPHVRAILVGGAATDAATLEEARTRGWPVLTTYGLTEACSQVATQALGSKSNDSGRALESIDVRIQNDGIEVRGDTLLSGYLVGRGPRDRFGLCLAPVPLHEGWFRTGDLGWMAADGTLHVRGRADATIISGGENVDPERVRSAIESLPGVVEAHVFPIPDPEWDVVVAAAVVTAPRTDAQTLRRALRATLASHEIPRRICFLDKLPRTPTGKVDGARLEADARLAGIDHET